jgi:hypothetical protein
MSVRRVATRKGDLLTILLQHGGGSLIHFREIIGEDLPRERMGR